MIEKIKTAFPKLVENKCFSVQNTDFGIRDDEGEDDNPAYVVAIDEDCHFKVENPSSKSIHFIAIDNCLWNNKDEIKCDCIVFDDASFVFLEIKKGSMGNMKKRREKAEKQLEATLQKFQAQINFEAYKIYAIIGFVKSKISPQIATRNQNLKDKWDEKYSIALMECNSWVFE